MTESNAVQGFTPSANTLHFDNSFPAGDTYPVVSLPVIGTVASGKAMNGICGGFTSVALDLFTHNPRLGPPDEQSLPAPGSALYTYLTKRFVDSLGPVAYENAAKAIDWTQSNSHDVLIQLTPGLGRRMATLEWPAIKRDIDGGLPSPLFLVMAPQCGFGDVVGIADALGNSHQVLAYGYSLDPTGNLTLQVYDPNDHTNDNSTMSLNIANPSATMAISAPGIESRFAQPHEIRGIFRAIYTSADPSSLGLTDFPVHGNNAAYVNQTAPSQIAVGQQAQATVVLRNTGTTTWSETSGHRLGSQLPQDNTTWGSNRQRLSAPIAPGEAATFTFAIGAPAMPGAEFQWRMVQDGVQWFGDPTPAVNIIPMQPAACLALNTQIKSAEAAIASLQQELHTGAGNKSMIIGQILDANETLADLRKKKQQLGCP